MSDTVTLTLRDAPGHDLELEGVAPDRFATLDAAAIAALPAWLGGRRVSLGDLFRVDGERASLLRVVGDLTRVHGLGAGMAGGTLTVDGSAGNRVGAGMTGGTIEVSGGVGDDAAQSMAGGVLRVRGRAGDRLGGAAPGASKGMTGGEIVVDGSAGAEAGARMRRGLVLIAGDAGERAARDIVAGSVIVLGHTARDAGRGGKRGTIVAVGTIEVPSTYLYACTYEPPHVRLTLTWLRRRYGLTIDERVVAGRYRRWCGDAGAPGKGEILQWTGE
jgi:formylmethanofuran dehydrogenase subunit C